MLSFFTIVVDEVEGVEGVEKETTLRQFRSKLKQMKRVPWICGYKKNVYLCISSLIFLSRKAEGLAR
jgi:hypothetical protein